MYIAYIKTAIYCPGYYVVCALKLSKVGIVCTLCLLLVGRRSDIWVGPPPSVLTIYQESYKVAVALFGCGETDYVTLLPGVAVQPCY